MTKETWFNISNVASIICGIWFFLAGWFWAYLTALFIAWPFGILGFVFWLIGRNAKTLRVNKIAGYILLTGVVTSIISFIIIFFIG